MQPVAKPADHLFHMVPVFTLTPVDFLAKIRISVSAPVICFFSLLGLACVGNFYRLWPGVSQSQAEEP